MRDDIDLTQEQLFKVLDGFCKRLVERGFTRDEVKAVLTFDAAAIADTVSEAFGDA